MGASLGLMVIHLTQGKKKFAAYEAVLSECEVQLSELRDEFLRFADRDEEVFLPLSKAYSLPKETEEESAEKDRIMEEALKDAATVPLLLMEKVYEAMKIVMDVAKMGSKLAISDAGCASAALRSALVSASFNVKINCKAMKNEETSAAFLSRMEELLEMGIRVSEDILTVVDGKL